MSTEYESNFCYGWNLNSDKALCETLSPFINNALAYYGLIPENTSYDSVYTPEDAMYEVSEALYGFAESIVLRNKTLFPLLSEIGDININWDNENSSFAIEVGGFNLLGEDVATMVVEMKILLHKIFEFHGVALENIEKKPCCFHYVSSF